MGFTSLGDMQRQLRSQMDSYNQQMLQQQSQVPGLQNDLRGLRQSFLPNVQGSAQGRLANTEWMTPLLRQQATNGNAAYDKAMQSAVQKILSNQRTGVQNVRERMAQQGLNSPLGINVENRVVADANQQIGDVTNQAALAQENFKQAALARLMGIDELGLSALNSDRGFFSNLLGNETGMAQYTDSANRQDYWRQQALNAQQEQADQEAIGNLIGYGLTLANPAAGLIWNGTQWVQRG